MLSRHGAFYLQIAVPFPEVGFFSRLVYASSVVALALYYCLHFHKEKDRSQNERLYGQEKLPKLKQMSNRLAATENTLILTASTVLLSSGYSS